MIGPFKRSWWVMDIPYDAEEIEECEAVGPHGLLRGLLWGLPLSALFWWAIYALIRSWV